jgi:phosphoadenosine phosphosulfate reductase
VNAEQRVTELTALLSRVVARHPPVGFASSFGAEDMVLTDLIARQSLPIAIFTLDTGRLPGETYELIDRVRAHYGLPLDVHCPDAPVLETYIRVHGVNGFYRSRELREGCCAIRKAAPLARALAGCGAWITGQRRAQSVTRRDLAIEEFDALHNMPKFNPLADWTEAEVWQYLDANDVPTNPLHARGYPSIGCAPCTRAIEPGEDIRAGRWWWEDPQYRECGLHRGSSAGVVPVAAAGGAGGRLAAHGRQE